jgi:hypothetical protein
MSADILALPNAPAPKIRVGQDVHGNPVVAWQGQDERFYRCWLERTHGRSGDRFMFVAMTDALGSKVVSEPIISPVFHQGSDLETLTIYAETRAASNE